jgi:glutamate synthase (NADPH/NADH) large chain
VQHWKASGLDLTPILTEIEPVDGAPRRHTVGQDHGLEKALDHTLIELSQEALRDKTPVRIELPIRNVNRAGPRADRTQLRRWHVRRCGLCPGSA